MKKAIAAALIAATLTGCGQNDGLRDGNRPFSPFKEETVVLNDGREITCIVYSAGISCDWSRK